MPPFSLLCVAALSVVTQDPVRVAAALTEPRVAVGATTTLVVTVETSGAAPDEIRIPALSRDLEILGTSDFTQTQITVPGGRTRSTRREIVLLARAPGVYRIPPVLVRVGASTYRTQTLDLIVSGTAPRSGAEGGSSRSVLRVWLHQDTVYVGEQVTLFAEVTFAEDMRARQSRPATFDPPAPTGFWVQDLPDPISIALRVREGRTVESQTYRRAYFPLAPGEYQLPPARLHYEVRRGFLYAPETRELVSDSTRLIVLPLPRGAPAAFNGAVGQLTLRASVAPTRVSLGEASVLHVELEGTGNVKALPQPELPQLPNAEVYPPSQDSRLTVTGDEVGGVKRFRWMIVPGESGTLTIPPIEYAVFDPELRTYVPLRSDTLRITVAPAVAAAPRDTTLRPLRAAPADRPLAWVRTPAFAALQALPLLLLVGAAGVRRRRARPPAPRDHARVLHRRLDQLESEGAGPELLAGLERVLRDAVEKVAGGPWPGAVAWLTRRDGAAAQELDTILDELHRLRYAPAEPYDAEPLVARVRAFVRSITPRRAWRARAPLWLIAAGSVPALSLAQPPAREDSFRAAVAEYERGSYIDAANAFHRYASAHPGDPNGWYDLGLAAHRAGDPGRAVWAWLRAARLAPRDGDLRHNLRVAGAEDAFARIAPPDRLAPDERALAGAAGWWLLALGLVAATLGARRVAALGIFPGAALIAVLAVVLLARAAEPARVTPMGNGALLYAAPTTREESLGRLEVGTLARLVEERDGWIRVRLNQTRDAWVERTAVATP